MTVVAKSGQAKVAAVRVQQSKICVRRFAEAADLNVLTRS